MERMESDSNSDVNVVFAYYLLSTIAGKSRRISSDDRRTVTR